MNCAAQRMNWKASAKNIPATPLAPSSAANTASTATVRCCSPLRAEDKENSGMESKSWLSKVCSKLRHKHRHEKCEKCGQRSDTCRPNPSFISGRKHYLCQDCRVSSNNMKTMYHQLCRNLSLREHSRTTTCNSGDLSPPTSSRGGLSRSKSMKVQPTSPESGYETATSLDSSCSERMSADPVSTSSGECGRCSPHPELSSCSPSTLHHHGDHDHSRGAAPADNHVCSRDRTEVFGGAFKSEKVHLHHLQQFMPKQRTYVRQSPAVPQQQNGATKTAHKAQPKDTATTKQYDGYLEIRTPNSRSVKYVFKKPESGEGSGHWSEPLQTENHPSEGKLGQNVKQCYRCQKRRSVAFRAPFGNGWLCEDCMDDLM